MELPSRRRRRDSAAFAEFVQSRSRSLHRTAYLLVGRRGLAPNSAGRVGGGAEIRLGDERIDQLEPRGRAAERGHGPRAAVHGQAPGREVAAARRDFPLGRDRQPGVFRYLADAHAAAAVPA